MLTTLDQIVERLVQGYDPDRIILFGSHAIGTSREDSDIDLLVVKDEVDRPAGTAHPGRAIALRPFHST